MSRLIQNFNYLADPPRGFMIALFFAAAFIYFSYYIESDKIRKPLTVLAYIIGAASIIILIATFAEIFVPGGGR